MTLRDKYRALLGAFSQQSILPSGYNLCEYLDSNVSMVGARPRMRFIPLLAGDIIKLKASTSLDSTYRTMIGDASNVELYFSNYKLNSYRNSFEIIKAIGGGYANIPMEIEAKVLSNSLSIVWLFDYSGAGTYNLYGRIYDNIQVIRNNQVILNRYCALDNNNRPCMYDVITKETFYNAGGGEFLYKLAENSGGVLNS